MPNNIAQQLTRIGQLLVLVITMTTVSHAVADDEKIGGLVVNKTITWYGQDFYHYFTRAWRNQRFQSKHSVVLEEYPSARKGTQVVIRYKGQVIYQTSIAGTRNTARLSGESAVSIVLSRTQEIDISSVGFQQADLGRDEF